jgi:hypothetical protein
MCRSGIGEDGINDRRMNPQQLESAILKGDLPSSWHLSHNFAAREPGTVDNRTP